MPAKRKPLAEIVTEGAPDAVEQFLKIGEAADRALRGPGPDQAVVLFSSLRGH
jgi:hypothetical protein